MRTERDNKKVLIVDDDQDFAESLLDILELRGYVAAMAHSPDQALNKLQEFGPHVCLIDIRLGRNSGIDLLAAIRDQAPDVLCVMMTAYPETDTAVAALQQGAYDYLRKPMSADDLLATLNRCFEKLQLTRDKLEAQQALRDRNEELHEINVRLREMVDSARHLAGLNRLDETGPRLLEEFANNMGAMGGSLYMLEDDALVLVHSLDPGHAVQRLELPLDDASPFGRVLNTGKAVLVDDIAEARELASSGWNGYRDGSLLAFPLHDRDSQTVGVLSLHGRGVGPFSERDRDLGLLLASFCSETLKAVQAADALRHSEKRYRRLFEESNDAILILADDATILDVNQRALDIMGRSRDELLGENVMDFHDPDERPVLEQKLRTILQEGSASFESKLMRPDERICYVDISASLVEPEVGLIQAIVRDVTERRRNQQNLERTVEQLAQSNAELERFAYVASHDLQEPLRNVATYVQMLQRRYGDRLDEEADEFIDYAVGGARRMQALIDDLLAYSRVGTRGKPFEKVDLEAVMEDVLNDMHQTIEQNRAEVACTDLPTVRGDKVQLGQVFQNLISNAIKFQTPDEPPRIEISVRDGGNEWLFTVSDNGIGFDPDYAERIFVIYERLHGGETYAGTGIGLAICKKIVERHGGRIWAESEPGEGATFHFTIAKQPGQQAELARQVAPEISR